MQEDKVSDFSSFITLTYDTTHVPITERGFMGLCKKDVQNFFKRLRKLHRQDCDKTHTEWKSLRYYAVGEYGGRSHRPHYHIILFNCKTELIQPAWSKNGSMIGTIHYGNVSGASVGYTLKYMCKVRRFPLHANDDRISEFALMSKGLGKNYLTPQMINYHKADPVERVCCITYDGKKLSMPRYYKEKIFNNDERLQIKAKYTEEMRLKEEEFYLKTDAEIHAITESHKAAFRKMYANYYQLKKVF